MFVSAIVVAAGLGKRFNKGRISKAVLRLRGRPLVFYALNILNKHPLISEIILVGNADNRDALRNIVKEYKIRKVSNIVLGGKERKDSVLQGIRDSSSKSDLILIHDGVRPFINARLLTSVIKAAHKAGAAVLGIPVKSTIKRADRNGFVETTLDRHRLWEIQTPQVFAKKLILTAFKKFGEIMATDDSMLVERLGKKIKIISGSYDNIKITTPEDMYVAEGIVKRCRCA